MSDRFNTSAGWVLFAGIVALGTGIVGSKIFHHEHMEEMVYAPDGQIKDEEAGGGGSSGAAADKPIAERLAAADVAAGEKVFAKCMACHSITQGGANGIGPNLYATVGEEVATGKAGFAFSDALKKKGGKWTFEALDEWLKDPRSFASGTKMSFAGLGKGEDRANVIAYLNAQGSNLPLPAVTAAPAAAEGAAPANAAEGGNAAEAK